MRSRLGLITLSLYLAVSLLGCSKKPPDNTTDNTSATGSATDTSAGNSGKESRERREERAERAEKKPIVVPAGTSVTVSLGSALGSKLSQTGQTFTGSVAQDVMVGEAVAIPKGANVSGTVTDAKPLGKFAGGAVLEVRLDSIHLNGSDLPVQAVRNFSAKGKGKRTAVLAGGGAALGGIVGALAGGGKGAAIGMAAGGGAGAGGAALTGNKDIVLPAEYALTFELSQQLEVKR